MKMWPWMRDLPTSVWAGHGWAFDENGLRRLSSSGGSHAMQGVEVFESVGLAAEQVKPSDEKIKEEAPIAVAAAENPPPTCEEQKPARLMKKNLAKQSGIPNIPKHGQKGPRNATRSREAEKPRSPTQAEKPRSREAAKYDTSREAEKPRSREAEKPRSPAQAEKPRSREAEKPRSHRASREAEKPRSRGAAGQAEKPRSREAEKPPGKPRSREAEKPPDKPRSREATGQAETVALEPPLNTMLHLHHHKTSTPQPPLNNTLHLETSAPPPPLNICCIFEDQASDPL